MKKLLFGLVAAMCCFAMAAPVFADIKVGGMVTSDVYYWERSGERFIQSGTTANQEDWSTVRFALPQAWNRLWVDYKSDDKKLAGYIQLRAGGIKGNTAAGTGTFLGGTNTFGENTFTWEYAWIDWHINPSLYFRMGRQTQAFAIYTPNQNMGHADGHIVGAGFGNIHGGTSRDGFRTYIKFSDAVRMEVGLYDPNTEIQTADEIGTAVFPSLPNSGNSPFGAQESNVIPRIDLALPMKFGNFSIEPSVTWVKQEWEGVAAGSDEDFDAWGAALGMKAGFGPFTISGEVTYGENLNSANYVGSTATITTFANAAGGVSIADAEELAAWIELGFDFGPFAIQGVVGYDKVENDGSPAALDFAEYEIERWMYGINFPIKVAKNFTITPNVFYYDYDDGAKVFGNANTNLGDELMVGVQFQIVF